MQLFLFFLLSQFFSFKKPPAHHKVDDIANLLGGVGTKGPGSFKNSEGVPILQDGLDNPFEHLGKEGIVGGKIEFEGQTLLECIPQM